MANISINKISSKPLEEQQIEYVERKGIGHPDSLIDGICDEVSHALCREYIGKFGVILHHNVDKGLIIGGSSDTWFGGGEITNKIEVIVTGRATEKFENRKIEVNDIAERVAEKYLKDNSRFLDLEKEVKIESKIRKGSEDLNSIFTRGNGVPLANDTSFGIGFAPLTETERLVLETEHFLNGKDYKRKIPAVGEDIKVMGMRDGDRIVLTIAIAFVAKFVKSIEEYTKYKELVAKDVSNIAKKLTEREVRIFVNTGDAEENEDAYLTKSGLSCESGDDGEVGRGNRVNGLITPFRQMSLEAAAGKNPVNHIGKIYNVLARELSAQVAKEYPQINECNIAVLSQIGHKIDDPLNLNINLIVEKGANFENIKSKSNYIAENWLENIGKFSLDLSLGKYKTF